MKLLAIPLLLLTAGAAVAKPLVVANDAWRATALADLAPLLRACLPQGDPAGPPALPVYKGESSDLDTKQVLRDPAVVGRGYWYRLGWRAKDGTVYIVAQRSPDGQRTVYGPVNERWTCLPADIRKELSAP